MEVKRKNGRFEKRTGSIRGLRWNEEGKKSGLVKLLLEFPEFSRLSKM